MVEIAVIETPSLGDRSYLATDGSVAFVIDPQRDVINDRNRPKSLGEVTQFNRRQ